MAGIKISDLTTVTPLSTDLVVLDRPSVGSGAPVTGKATLTAIQSLIGGSGGNEYWQSVNLGELIATGTLVAITGTLQSQFLSSSAGAEITGSSVFYVVEPNQSVVISGSANSGAKALDVIDAAFGPGLEYSAFYVDPANLGVVAGTTDPSNYIALTNDSIYPKVSVVSGSNSIELSPALDTISINVLSTLPTASLQVLDSLNNLSTLDLKIGSLQVNGDAGTSGYVLTSNGDSSAPTWQASVGGGGGNEYWQSTTSDLIFATGTIGAYISGSLRALYLSASAGAEVTGTLDINGGLQVTGSVNVSNGVRVDSGDLQVGGIVAVTGSSYLLGGVTGSSGLELSGSAIFVGDGGVSIGTDTSFFVSGSTNDTNKAVFGGDLHVSGNVQINFNTGIQARNSASNDYADIIRLADATNLGYGDNIVAFGDNSKTTGFGYLNSNNVVALITGSNQGYFSGSYQFPQGISGSLTKLTDGTSYLIAGTNVTIVTGANGAVTISSTGGGGGSSPEFWFSTVANESYTTGSVYINAGANGNQNLIKFDVSGSEYSSLGSSLFFPSPGAYIVVEDIPVADASWNSVSGSLRIAAASVMASGSGGELYMIAGDGGYASGSSPANLINGGLIALYPGAGGQSDDTSINGGLGGALAGTAGSGGAGYTTAGAGGAVSFSAGSGGGKSDSNTTDQFSAGAGGDIILAGGYGGSPLFGSPHVDFIGGVGGTVTLAGGTGGGSEGSTNTGGQGGSVNISGGLGGNTTGAGTGGAGGTVIIQPGIPGLDANGQTYNAGSLEIYGGAIPFSSASSSASVARIGVAQTGETAPGDFKGFNYIIMNDPVDDPNLGGSASVYTDMFLYVSGAIGSKDTLTRGTSIFGGDVAVSGTMSLEGGFRTLPTIVTSLPYTASMVDYIIAVSASAGPGVALPSAAMIGRNYVVKDVSGSAGIDNINVSVDGGGLIDGSSSYTISINRGSATFVYFGNSIGWGVI